MRVQKQTFPRFFIARIHEIDANESKWNKKKKKRAKVKKKKKLCKVSPLIESSPAPARGGISFLGRVSRHGWNEPKFMPHRARL